jgi:molybdate transport system substrate-binding protein
MARATSQAVGVTQVSEILAVREVVLVGPYPRQLQEITTYSGAVLTAAARPEAAGAYLRFLASAPVQERFRRAGFEPPSGASLR